jgi:hypothetical protein
LVLVPSLKEGLRNVKHQQADSAALETQHCKNVHITVVKFFFKSQQLLLVGGQKSDLAWQEAAPSEVPRLNTNDVFSMEQEA